MSEAKQKLAGALEEDIEEKEEAADEARKDAEEIQEGQEKE